MGEKPIVTLAKLNKNYLKFLNYVDKLEANAKSGCPAVPRFLELRADRYVAQDQLEEVKRTRRLKLRKIAFTKVNAKLDDYKKTVDVAKGLIEKATPSAPKKTENQNSTAEPTPTSPLVDKVKSESETSTPTTRPVQKRKSKPRSMHGGL